LRRPVRRTAEPRDDKLFRRYDHDVLPDGAFCEERIARHAAFGAVRCTKTVAEIGPEAGAHADPGGRRRLSGIFHPAFGQDALAAHDAVVEIELAEPRPVARAGEHLARTFRIA